MFSSIQNYYEEIVFEYIAPAMQERGESLEIDLIEDIACIALNHLPPRYIRHSVDLVSNMSDIEHTLMKDQVLQAIHEAIEISKRRRTPH